jgi:O-antigen/teichoic acid export membrane protein
VITTRRQYGKRQVRAGFLRARTAGGNALATLVARGATTVAQALAFSVVAKTYGVGSLDSYALGFTVATFAGLVLDFGTGTWVTRSVALGRPASAFLLARIPLLAVLVTAAVIATASGATSPAETAAILVMSVAIAISLLGQGFFWGKMRHDCEMAFAVAESCLVLALLEANHIGLVPGHHPLLYTAAAYALGAAGRSVVLVRGRGLDAGAVNVGGWWKQMHAYGLQSLVTIASTQLDTILLSALVVGPATGTVAAYALAMRVYYAAPMPLQAVGAALLPRFVKDPGRQTRVAVIGTLAGSIAAIGGAAVFVAIIPLFGYGGAVVAQLRSVMEILSLAFLARCVAYVLGAFITAQGGQRSRLWTSVGALGSMVGLDFVLIPAYGAKGAAIAMVVSDWVLFTGYLLGAMQIIRRRQLRATVIRQAAMSRGT